MAMMHAFVTSKEVHIVTKQKSHRQKRKGSTQEDEVNMHDFIKEKERELEQINQFYKRKILKQEPHKNLFTKILKQQIKKFKQESKEFKILSQPPPNTETQQQTQPNQSKLNLESENNNFTKDKNKTKVIKNLSTQPQTTRATYHPQMEKQGKEFDMLLKKSSKFCSSMVKDIRNIDKLSKEKFKYFNKPFFKEKRWTQEELYLSKKIQFKEMLLTKSEQNLSPFLEFLEYKNPDEYYYQLKSKEETVETRYLWSLYQQEKQNEIDEFKQEQQDNNNNEQQNNKNRAQRKICEKKRQQKIKDPLSVDNIIANSLSKKTQLELLKQQLNDSNQNSNQNTPKSLSKSIKNHKKFNVKYLESTQNSKFKQETKLNISNNNNNKSNSQKNFKLVVAPPSQSTSENQDQKSNYKLKINTGIDILQQGQAQTINSNTNASNVDNILQNLITQRSQQTSEQFSNLSQPFFIQNNNLKTKKTQQKFHRQTNTLSNFNFASTQQNSEQNSQIYDPPIYQKMQQKSLFFNITRNNSSIQTNPMTQRQFQNLSSNKILRKQKTYENIQQAMQIKDENTNNHDISEFNIVNLSNKASLLDEIEHHSDRIYQKRPKSCDPITFFKTNQLQSQEQLVLQQNINKQRQIFDSNENSVINYENNYQPMQPQRKDLLNQFQKNQPLPFQKKNSPDLNFNQINQNNQAGENLPQINIKQRQSEQFLPAARNLQTLTQERNSLLNNKIELPKNNLLTLYINNTFDIRQKHAILLLQHQHNLQNQIVNKNKNEDIDYYNSEKIEQYQQIIKQQEIEKVFQQLDVQKSSSQNQQTLPSLQEQETQNEVLDEEQKKKELTDTDVIYKGRMIELLVKFGRMRNKKSDQIIQEMLERRAKKQLTEQQLKLDLDNQLVKMYEQYKLLKEEYTTNPTLKRRNFIIEKAKERIYADKKPDSNTLFQKQEEWLEDMKQCTQNNVDMKKQLHFIKIMFNKCLKLHYENPEIKKIWMQRLDELGVQPFILDQNQIQVLRQQANINKIKNN